MTTANANQDVIHVKLKRVGATADKLYEIQQKRLRLQEKVKSLLVEEEALIERLRSSQGNSTFTYSGQDGYLKIVNFAEFQRRILDQKKAKRLLGDKTPYKNSTVRTVSVGYVYE